MATVSSPCSHGAVKLSLVVFDRGQNWRLPQVAARVYRTPRQMKACFFSPSLLHLVLSCPILFDPTAAYVRYVQSLRLARATLLVRYEKQEQNGSLSVRRIPGYEAYYMNYIGLRTAGPRRFH
jgi:hypothetical protein